MKATGKTAWMITLDGPESEFFGRCRVVAILPPKLSRKTIVTLLPGLFCSEYTYTLCEKMSFSVSDKRDPLFRQPYHHENPEFLYGYPPKIYLCARKVKDLRCEESKQDCDESTLHWTELAKFISNPNFNRDGPMPADLSELTIQAVGELEVYYTYSTRPSIEEEKRRIAGKIPTGTFSIKPRA